ncbi:MAG: nucleoside kinase [Dysgonamonadaceae bacterium]|jgi:uridine kinase|nr:nucleoside kinase [Dysgonamonadaceae bacterium]
MEEKIRIYCKNIKKYQDFNLGISLLEIYEEMQVNLPYQLASVRVNNKTENLNFRCYTSKDVEFFDLSDSSGMRTYVRSLCFILSKAVNDLFPGKEIYIEHPVSKGYYCDLALGRPITDEDVEHLKARMQEIIDQSLPFETHSGQTAEVVKLFRKYNMEDKAILLETVGKVYSTYNLLGGHIDYYYGALLPDTGWVYLFGLEKLNGGLLLRVPDMQNPLELQPFVRQEKMMGVFQDHLKFQRIMGMSNVGDLNRTHESGFTPSLVKVAEAIQEKLIARIADEIAEKYNDGVRIVLISGPSSSGKTTFCKRLQVQLMTNTIRPMAISLDDYYVDRINTPLDESGEYDFESLYAIDLHLFNSDLKKILAGKEIALPTYDFTQGKRIYRGNTIRLEENSVLVMEGIHALNPELLPEIDHATTYKIYVSALTTISLDNHNWISTTDNRLIRRIVRDYQFRKYSAKETIARWVSVRKGEDKWIFPYQEGADAMFNSAMLYELAVLRKYAEPILAEVLPRDPEYAEAYRLSKFLKYFVYIDIDELPNTSLLREFLGGSSFRY